MSSTLLTSGETGRAVSAAPAAPRATSASEAFRSIIPPPAAAPPSTPRPSAGLRLAGGGRGSYVGSGAINRTRTRTRNRAGIEFEFEFEFELATLQPASGGARARRGALQRGSSRRGRRWWGR